MNECEYIYIYIYIHTHTHTHTRSYEEVLKLPVANRTCSVNFNMTAHLLVNPCATDTAPRLYTECQSIHFVFGLITATQRQGGGGVLEVMG